MKKILSIGFHLIFCLGLCGAMARAGCDAPDFIFEKDGEAEFVRKIKPQGIKAAQGIVTVKYDGVEKIALSSGYWANNSLVLDFGTGFVESKNNLSSTLPSQLLASVHEAYNGLWWTSYREEKIYNTDLRLKRKKEIAVPGLIGAVGLSSIASGTKIIVPTRLKPHQLIVLDAVELELLERFNLIGFDQAPYDIDTNENCIFFVESSFGRIWSLDQSEIQTAATKFLEQPEFIRWIKAKLGLKANLKPNVWFDQAKRIQHLNIKNNVVYVIDTDDYSIITIDLKNHRVRKYILPIKHIFRGLAVGDNGSVLLTGFEDKVDIRGDRTAVFEFRLNHETN